MNHIANNRGVSLVEVVISLAILVFGILSLMLLYTSGIKGTVKAQALTRKNNQATSQIEDIIFMKYKDLKTSCNKASPCCKEKTIQNITTKTCYTVEKDIPIKHTKKVVISTEMVNPANPNATHKVSYQYIKPYHPSKLTINIK